VTDILPDVLKDGLRLVVCGSAAGTKSAAVGAYYAGPGNRFWPTLHRVGLTPILIAPRDFGSVLGYGIGLTDIVKKRFGGDSVFRRDDYDPEGLRRRIERFQPRILAFNGKNAAKHFYQAKVDYGWRPGGDIGATRVFVAPSTSRAANGFWNEDLWRELAGAVLAP